MTSIMAKRMKYILPMVFALAATKSEAFWGFGSINYSNVSIVNVNALLYPFYSDSEGNNDALFAKGVFLEPSLGLAGANLFFGYGIVGDILIPFEYEVGGVIGRTYLFDYGLKKNRTYYGIALKNSLALIPIKFGYLIEDKGKSKIFFEIGVGI